MLKNEKMRLKYLDDLENDKTRMPLVRLVFDDYVVRPFNSPDGRTIALPAAAHTYFIDPSTM
jgi:hypothetical protein